MAVVLNEVKDPHVQVVMQGCRPERSEGPARAGPSLRSGRQNRCRSFAALRTTNRCRSFAALRTTKQVQVLRCAQDDILRAHRSTNPSSTAGRSFAFAAIHPVMYIHFAIRVSLP